jgi:outer membrane protein assembly factor BamE (lipoprotein component of BamABCDE complex)
MSALAGRGLVIFALLAALGGCMPVPYVIPALGYTPDSRHNLGERVPPFIIQGETSREDVLFTLGDPDETIDDGHVFIYLSAYRRGGMGTMVLIYQAHDIPAFNSQRTLFHRLTVEFDAAGRVSSASEETNTCWMESDTSDWMTHGRGNQLTVRATDRCLKAHDSNAPAAQPRRADAGKAPG